VPHPIHSPWLLFKHLLFMANIVNPYTPAELEGLRRAQNFEKTGSGYMSIQSTKPQTLGYGLTDSPVGLLAWIYEKLVTWADEGHIWDDDEGSLASVHNRHSIPTYHGYEYAVLTWVSIYWFSRAGPAASLRTYYGMSQKENKVMPQPGDPGATIPFGVSFFPGELGRFPAA